MELDDTFYKHLSQSETPLSLSSEADVESKSLEDIFDDRSISGVDYETNDLSHSCNAVHVADLHESLSSREATPSPIQTLHIEDKDYVHESDLVSCDHGLQVGQPSQPSCFTTESYINRKKDLENGLVCGPDLQVFATLDPHESAPTPSDCKVNFDFGVSASSFEEDDYPASVHSRAESPNEEEIAFDFGVLSSLDAASLHEETTSSNFVSSSGYVSAMNQNNHISISNGAVSQYYGYMKEQAKHWNLDMSDLCDLSPQAFSDDSGTVLPHCTDFNFRDIIGFSNTSDRLFDNSSSSCVLSVSSGYISSETSQYCDSGLNTNITS